MRTPTTVDLERNILIFFFSLKPILQLPDVDRYTLSSQQAGNDAKTEAVAHVGEDHHGHWDEVEVLDEIEREKIGVAEFCKEAHGEEGEEYYHRCGEEDPLPEDFLLSHRYITGRQSLTGCICEESRRSIWHRRFW